MFVRLLLCECEITRITGATTCRAYGKAGNGNGNETETGNGNWKRKPETENRNGNATSSLL